MRCKTCGYTLWNLTARTCPECGSSFRPSDFQFRPNAVRFMCPHCGQAYYGTDGQGHLVPRAFDCVSCARPITMDETVLAPAEGVDERTSAAAENPWLDPARRGIIRPWWSTVVMSMIRPTELARATPGHAPLTRSWGFGMLNLGAVFLAGLAAMFACFGGVSLMAGQGGGAPGLAPALLGQGIFQLARLVLVLVCTLLWIGATHGLLRLSGPAPGTVRVTAHAILYASGFYVLSVIPCVGYFMLIGWVVSATLMVMAGHGVSGGRAAFATLTPPVTVFLLLVGGYAAFIVWIAGSSGVYSSPYPTPAPADLRVVANAVEARAARAGGWDHTDHALRLVTDRDLLPWELEPALIQTVFAAPSASPVEDAIADAEQRLADHPLPEDVVAHRVGPFVFAYHGVDSHDPPDGLWLIIQDTQPRRVYRSDGSTRRIDPEDWPDELAAQNERRAELGLSPLPDPAAITEDRPALSADAGASP